MVPPCGTATGGYCLSEAPEVVSSCFYQVLRSFQSLETSVEWPVAPQPVHELSQGKVWAGKEHRLSQESGGPLSPLRLEAGAEQAYMEPRLAGAASGGGFWGNGKKSWR